MEPSHLNSSEYSARSLIYYSQKNNRAGWAKAIGDFKKSSQAGAKESFTTLVNQIFQNVDERQSVTSFLLQKKGYEKLFDKILKGKMLSPDKKSEKCSSKIKDLKQLNQLNLYVLSVQSVLSNESPLELASSAEGSQQPIPTTDPTDQVAIRGLEERKARFDKQQSCCRTFNQASETLDRARRECQNKLLILTKNSISMFDYQREYDSFKAALNAKAQAEVAYLVAREAAQQSGAKFYPMPIKFFGSSSDIQLPRTKS